MQQHFRHNEKAAPIRWGVVVRAVLAACAVALVVFAAWYALAIALPVHRRAEQERAFESVELQRLVARVIEIERFVHLPTPTDQ